MTERARGSTPGDFTVGQWLVQPSLNRIGVGNEVTRLRPQLMNLLVCLADRPGQTVSREEILATVWPGQYIAETGLARCITQLRQALGDSAGPDSKFIETIPKRGYRLIAPVARIEARAPVAVITGPAAPDPAYSAASSPAPAVPGAGPAASPGAPSLPHAGAPDVPGGPSAHARGFLPAAAAAVALGLAVAGFFAWRTLLRPDAVERDTLVIAFENTTGDQVFDEALRLALSKQLEQSPALRVVSDQRVHEALGFMDRPSDTPLTRAVALELCQRVGAKAIVSGSLALLGSRYTVGLEGLACESGEVIGREQVEAPAKEAVLGALGQATSAIRARLGESVASIRRHDVPIAQATTSSLDALRAFSQGDAARARGEDEDAIRFYRRAIEIAPSFALAHVRLGLQLLNLSRHGEAVVELTRAYELRDRASEAERFYITSFYRERVLRDPIGAIEPLELWRDAYPKSVIPRFTLAALYLRAGRLEDAVPQAEEALRLEPNHSIAISVLVETLARNGRFEDARRLAERHLAEGRGGVLLHLRLAQIAFILGDGTTVRRELEWAALAPAAITSLLETQGALARFSGRFAEAALVAVQEIAQAEQRGDEALAAIVHLVEATDRASVGQAREAVPLVLAALQRARTAETLIRGALALAWAGEADRAEQLLREYERMPDVTAASDPDFRPAAIALITMGRGFPQSALGILEPLKPYERGWRFNQVPSYLRGLALMQLKRPGEAVAEFSRIVKARGALMNSLVYPLSWLQLARAKAAAGDPKGARAAYEQFLEFWTGADADLPALVQAREELRRLP
jgi:DNA-binding winged helix-turn-helix (wHTH) protein/tetratricopeptide (TPR) repeat protein